MRKISLGIFITVMVLSLSGVAGAGKLIPAADQAKEKARAENSLAINEVDGHWALTPPGLEKIVFIHYEKGFAKPPWAGGGGKESKGPKCYEFLGKGVSWKELPVNYVIDPTNLQGLSETFVVSAMSAGAEEWDSWTGAELFNNTYTVDYDGSWDNGAPDGRNELLFGNYPKEGVIAVTVIWGYFSGPPSSRRIVEFDILFDTDYTWGDAVVDPAVMDLQNIAVHELGHGVGLADLYDVACSAETMYGYSNYGELKKRDLNAGDIMGVQELYGGF